ATRSDGAHFFFFSSRRRHTRWPRDWSSDVCSSDLGGADDSGQVRAFRNGQLPHVFPEVRHAGFGKAANPEAAAIPQIHFVRVHFENSLLAEALLELQRNQGLGHLSPPVAVGREEEGPRHLHGDGARALVVLAGVPEVRPRGADDANEIKSAVLEKALVFS